MTEIKRATYLFFYFADEVYFDAEQLVVEGRVAFGTRARMRVISVLAEREFSLEPEHVEILGALPSDRFIAIAKVIEEHRVARELLHEWAEKGLVIIDGSDVTLVEYRRRDEALTAACWNKYALLYHFMGKWKDVRIRAPEFRDTDQFLEAVGARQERFKKFIELFGRPPAHFYKPPNILGGQDLPLVHHSGSLYDVLTRRKTTRAFNAHRPMTIEQLALVLYYVWGCHGYWRVFEGHLGLKKTSPSGGDLHPTEVYPIIRNVEGVAPGVYHYDVEHHRLDLLRPLDREEVPLWIDEFASGQSFFMPAHATFLMTTRFQRSYWKYRTNSRVYSVLQMDAGHLSQTFYLVSTELGLGAFVTAALNTVNIEKKLGFDPMTEAPVALCGCGWPGPDEFHLEVEYSPYVPRQTVLAADAEGTD
jgi:putative peptide maturation dehydrogenase